MGYDITGILCYGVALDWRQSRSALWPWDKEGDYYDDPYGWMEDKQSLYPNIELVLAGDDEEDPFYIITHKDVSFYSFGEPEVVVMPDPAVIMKTHAEIGDFCRKELVDLIEPFFINWYLASAFNM